MYKQIGNYGFECKRCGKCCQWPGYVFLEDRDVERLSGKLTGNNKDEFLRKYTKTVGNKGNRKLVLLSDSDNRCIFLNNNNECDIYDFRPEQCELYPTEYDPNCPGFFKIEGVADMEENMQEKVAKVNDKLSNSKDFEKKVLRGLYSNLEKNIKSSSISKIATKGEMGGFFDDETIKIANLDDLFSFNRLDDKHLIHKATRDLWAIESDDKGEVHITRLFESGKPVKG